MTTRETPEVVLLGVGSAQIFAANLVSQIAISDAWVSASSPEGNRPYTDEAFRK